MKIIIPLLVAGVAVVVLFFYGLINGPSSVNKNVDTSESAVFENELSDSNEPKEFRGETTFLGLQALGQNVECRISYDAPEQTEPVIGTYFVSEERIRGDFEVSAPELGGEVVSSIIIADGQFYSWSRIDGQAYGIKFDMSESEPGDESMTRQPVPNDAQVSYECTEWKNVDGSIFVPPTDVLFQDASNLLQSGMEYGTVYENGEF